MQISSKLLLKTLLLSSVIAISPMTAFAADGDDNEVNEIEEVVTVGTRRKGRTVTQSLAPVDVFNEEAIETSGYSDVNDILRTLVPSFNIKRNATNDGTMLVRPFTMKGAPPDHVLLLLNGKRRHKSALVQLSGGYNTVGSQGSDFGQLPTIAFKDIQVLRDGAAAQYGSDAIAGVVNLSMKDASEGGSIIASYGQFFKGDGESIDISGNVGLPLTENGFINLSMQYLNAGLTDRSVQYKSVAPLIAKGIKVRKNAMAFGNPDSETLKLAWNAGIDISDAVSVYFFGNFTISDTTGTFWYRNPLGNSAFKNSIYDESAEHPEVFDLNKVYPGGFTPIFGANVKDFSQVTGLRGETDSELSWDVSLRYGRSDIDYHIENTYNPSMGVRSPTSFKPGTLAQREMQTNLDLSYPIKTDMFASDLIVSAGLEYKDEAYIIGAGDEASYMAGPLKDLPNGSNGFQGYSPSMAGTFKRNNYSVYIDLETDITDRWSIGIAGRYEDYSDFGDTANYKASTRFEISDSFALRATVSSGFRAPSVGQIYTRSISTDFTTDAIPIPIISAAFQTHSPEAAIFDAEPLGPEKSKNISAGFVYSPDNGFSLTVDFYQIDVTERMLLAGPYNVSPAQAIRLKDIGFTSADFLDQVRFFQNSFDTRTRGVDIVATYSAEWEDDSSTDFMFAWNYNDQKLTDTSTFGEVQTKNFEDGVPAHKGSLTVFHRMDKFSMMVRGNYYGTAYKGKSAPTPHLKFDPALLLDLELTYHFSDDIDISLTGRNVLDKYPGGWNAEAWGSPYWTNSPYGYNGGYYSVRVKYNF